jgi:hypothetical protein
VSVFIGLAALAVTLAAVYFVVDISLETADDIYGRRGE